MSQLFGTTFHTEIQKLNQIFPFLKSELKKQQVLIHQHFQKNHLTSLKSHKAELIIRKLIAPTMMNNLKSKEDELDVTKLRPDPVRTKRLSDAVDENIFKDDKFNKL